MAKQDPKLRYNCYLLRDGLESVEQALRAKYRSGGAQQMQLLHPTMRAPKGSVAYLGKSVPRQPAWAQELDATFTGAGAVTNISHRLIIFMPVEKRWFAVCFGYGSSALEWDEVESNFGLRVAARRFEPELVQELRSRRVDSTARTQSVTLPSGAQLRDFGVPLEGEFVRRMIGRLDGLDASGAVVAGDSIIFRAGTDLGIVQSELTKMLKDLETTNAKDQFSFVDALEPLRNGESVSKELDQVLAASILQRPLDVQKLGPAASQWNQQILDFAPPDDVRIEDVDHFEIRYADRSHTFTGLDLGSLRSALKEVKVNRGANFLRSARIVAVSSDGQPASQLQSVRNWLVYEASRGAARYILTLGSWFRLGGSYASALDKDIAKIPDVTGALGLAIWDESWHEKKYNEEAVKGRLDMLNLDRNLCSTEDGDRIEACDLLHRDGYLIHVKRYNGSQTLSHLFGQGTISAELLKLDSVTKPQFVSKVAAMDNSFRGVANDAAKRVTYAIGIDDGRGIPSGLPTFSKVNLRDHARRLRMLGAEPSVATIVIS